MRTLPVETYLPVFGGKTSEDRYGRPQRKESREKKPAVESIGQKTDQNTAEGEYEYVYGAHKDLILVASAEVVVDAGGGGGRRR